MRQFHLLRLQWGLTAKLYQLVIRKLMERGSRFKLASVSFISGIVSTSKELSKSFLLFWLFALLCLFYLLHTIYSFPLYLVFVQWLFFFWGWTFSTGYGTYARKMCFHTALSVFPCPLITSLSTSPLFTLVVSFTSVLLPFSVFPCLHH